MTWVNERKFVLTDEGAEVHYKGKIVAKGPIWKIRQFLDDQDELDYLRRWARLNAVKKNRRARCRKRLITKAKNLITNHEIPA